MASLIRAFLHLFLFLLPAFLLGALSIVLPWFLFHHPFFPVSLISFISGCYATTSQAKRDRRGVLRAAVKMRRGGKQKLKRGTIE
ncbi:hypothetical protein F5B17DRAFT_282269 [Nemania serpens]|nr:hypothetical protein F5B17DRAFT_282269 [Nemania serpens]